MGGVRTRDLQRGRRAGALLWIRPTRRAGLLGDWVAVWVVRGHLALDRQNALLNEQSGRLYPVLGRVLERALQEQTTEHERTSGEGIIVWCMLYQVWSLEYNTQVCIHMYVMYTWVHSKLD